MILNSNFSTHMTYIFNKKILMVQKKKTKRLWTHCATHH